VEKLGLGGAVLVRMSTKDVRDPQEPESGLASVGHVVSGPPVSNGKDHKNFYFEELIQEICRLPWEGLNADEILRVALAYYYFSVQFRENLEIACRLSPNDKLLKALHRGECNTANLSPWENIAADGEAMNHDEFMRRLLALQPIAGADAIERNGQSYLALTRSMDDRVRAMSIRSYEDGGLLRVFSSMLRATGWEGEGQRAFRHFLELHIRFDCETTGHGALSRHIALDDSIAPLWLAFRDLLRCAVPAFADEHDPQPAAMGVWPLSKGASECEAKR